jgi:hypothetical protein
VLLKNILGLLVPEQGEIWVDGDQIVLQGPLARPGEPALAARAPSDQLVPPG